MEELVSSSDCPTPKVKWPRETACDVAREICRVLKPVTEKLVVAGSLRRGRAMVGDVEILFVPLYESRKTGLFETENVNLADECISQLIADGVLESRGAWGAKNKLARHCLTQVPVDLFTATNENWWNYLVCRTGPAELNERIARAARERGWKWNPYSPGFVRLDSTTGKEWTDPNTGEPNLYAVESEQELFQFVNIAFAEPHLREFAKYEKSKRESLRR